MIDSKRFIRNLMVAVSNCAMYGSDHPAVADLSEKILDGIGPAGSGEDGQIELKIIEGELILNGNRVPDPGPHGVSLAKRLRRKGVTQFRISRGITGPEIKDLIMGLASREGTMSSSPNIAMGTVSVQLTGISLDGTAGDGEFADLRDDQLDRLKEVYENFSPFRQLNVSGLEEIVVNFIVAFRQQANILSLISPVRSHSEYTYTHATNVSILSMYQAESLGFEDELVQEIGIGGLLHDAGKMFVSNEILEKKGKLDDREWEEIRRHPAYGARYLARIEGIPRIVPILAYEHHLRYDGKGYPSSRMGRNTQSFCSQMLALSDFFDALRSRRPYKREWQVEEILALMKENAGKEFNPVLVDNFVHLMLSNPKPA